MDAIVLPQKKKKKKKKALNGHKNMFSKLELTWFIKKKKTTQINH